MTVVERSSSAYRRQGKTGRGQGVGCGWGAGRSGPGALGRGGPHTGTRRPLRLRRSGWRLVPGAPVSPGLGTRNLEGGVFCGPCRRGGHVDAIGGPPLARRGAAKLHPVQRSSRAAAPAAHGVQSRGCCVRLPLPCILSPPPWRVCIRTLLSEFFTPHFRPLAPRSDDSVPGPHRNRYVRSAIKLR